MESPLKSKKLILSTTVTKENNPWWRVAKTGCKRFHFSPSRVWEWYAVALTYVVAAVADEWEFHSAALNNT
jgi:hypothetical protein